MNEERTAQMPEPWLRGTLAGVPAVARAVLHALQLAEEDLQHWAGTLTDEQLNLCLPGIAPVAFHLRHIARSLDRLLTYAEGRQLSAKQIALLASELEAGASRDELLRESSAGFKTTVARLLVLATGNWEEKREVGAKRLPTTLGGLLVHVADHTQRHVGQVVTTAKIVASKREYDLRPGSAGSNR